MRTMAGLIFGGNKSMTLPLTIKPATTYHQQIELLESRGLIILDKDKALDILSRLNYYTFTGYLHDFKIDGVAYKEGLTFEKVYQIIEFDRRFRNILLYTIETIENTLKTKISYNFAHSFGPEGHLDVRNFKSKAQHDVFIKKLDYNTYNNRNLPFIKHHAKKYVIYLYIGGSINNA
jgi:abortive infection bacteriophage resistance protein